VLSEEHPSAARAIEMRYFGGMTAEETALSLGRTVHVVQHDLRFAHAWLRRRLSSGDA
jgi:DNA-directed RNA polymerase specialized sigma24 family protein